MPKFNGISPPWDSVDQALRYVAMTLKQDDVLLGKIVLVLDESKSGNSDCYALPDGGDVNIHDPLYYVQVSSLSLEHIKQRLSVLYGGLRTSIYETFQAYSIANQDKAMGELHVIRAYQNLRKHYVQSTGLDLLSILGNYSALPLGF